MKPIERLHALVEELAADEPEYFRYFRSCGLYAKGLAAQRDVEQAITQAHRLFKGDPRWMTWWLRFEAIRLGLKHVAKDDPGRTALEYKMNRWFADAAITSLRELDVHLDQWAGLLGALFAKEPGLRTLDPKDRTLRREVEILQNARMEPEKAVPEKILADDDWLKDKIFAALAAAHGAMAFAALAEAVYGYDPSGRSLAKRDHLKAMLKHLEGEDRVERYREGETFYVRVTGRPPQNVVAFRRAR